MREELRKVLLLLLNKHAQSGTPSIPTYAEVVAALTPLAYWPLNELSGTTANDISGNGFHGTTTNVSFGSTGIGDGNTAASFTGNGYVNVYSAGLQSVFPVNEGSMAIWCKPVAIDSVGYKQAFSFETNGGVEFSIALTGASPNKWQGARYNAPNGVVQVDASNTQWAHIVIAWSDAGNTLKLYINGVLSATDPNAATIGAFFIPSNKALIGAYSTASAFWNGLLAHAVLFSREISQAEVTVLSLGYNSN